jgi:hypothetical protein
VKGPADGKEITLKLGGYVDAYYAYHTRGDNDIPLVHPNPGAAIRQVLVLVQHRQLRAESFESPGQQFSLGLIQTKFEAGNEDFQIVADLIHGPNAELTNFNNLRGGASSTTSTAIKQAYVAANIAKGLKLTAGQFGTHIGYEVVESYQNANYMLGYLFGFGPFYHTGAKLDYSILDGKVGFHGRCCERLGPSVRQQQEQDSDWSDFTEANFSPVYLLNYAGGNETNSNCLRYNCTSWVACATSVTLLCSTKSTR